MEMLPEDVAELLDWKRRIGALYARVREAGDPHAAWKDWRATRDEMFRTHPQTPVPKGADFKELPYFDYDPAARVLGEVIAAEPKHLDVTTSTDGAYGFTRYGTVHFDLYGKDRSLDCLWVEGYGGGLFLSFRDGTSGTETYGACRYLYDTIKGADLGGRDGELVLDFNFAYNPSCSYDPRWSCPLAAPNNHLDVAVRAGERYPAV